MDFPLWQKKALGKLNELLGILPEKVPLNARVISSADEGGYIRKRITIDTDRFSTLTAVVLIPKTEGRKPAILCCHGHNPFGKEPVAGTEGSEELRREIEGSNYDYALQMAKHGFVTMAPDLRGFGERADLPDPVDIPRDPCNVNYVKGSILGIYPLALNIFDMMCCIDYLCALDEVDSGRIGMMGLSLGGTVTTFTTALDSRIKACDIIGYVNSFEAFGMRDGNFCGSQVLPGLYRYFDTWDIAGLIAPRPCLVEMGTDDQCFRFEDLERGFGEMCDIYAAAGCRDRISSDVHPGGHAFSGRRAFGFFSENL